MTKRSPKKPTRSQATSSNDPHPQQPAQGISGRLFGLLKKFPMPISSPTKENSPLSEHFTQSSQSEHHPDAEDEEVEDDNDDDDEDDEDDDDDDEDDSDHVEDEEYLSDDEDLLGDQQCDAIMENYLLETTTRTNFLRTRTLTHFRPALRRRLEFELARITPSIANVTALDYHQRDNGILRRTMEFVARLAIEQKGIEIGIKRSQSQETPWDDLQKNHHKRKRALNSTAESTSSKSGQPSYPGQSEEVDPTSLTSSSKPRRPSQRSKPPTSNSAHSLLSQSHSKSSFAPTDLNPRLPSTPSMSEFKPVRLARRNESLLSVNGSPVLPNGADDSQSLMKSQFSDLFPRVPSQGEIFGGGQKIEFTFVEKSKWRELEDKLKGLDMKESERKKLDELLKSCINLG